MSTKKGMMTGPKRRPPSLEYKIRQIGVSYGKDYFGISVPSFLANQFSGSKLALIVTGSGFSYVRKEVVNG